MVVTRAQKQAENKLAAQEVLREEIKSLLEQNIIEPSKSPWSAAIVLVPKKMELLECVWITESLMP